MPDDLRALLVATGVELVAAEGTAALTLREIARRAGVSHGAPRRYFPTHRELLAAVARVGYERLSARIAALNEQPAAAAVGVEPGRIGAPGEQPGRIGAPGEQPGPGATPAGQPDLSATAGEKPDHHPGPGEQIDHSATPGEQAGPRTRSGEQLDPRAGLLALGRLYLDFARTDRGMFELMFRHELLRGNQEGLRAASRPLFAVLVDLVAAARPGRDDAAVAAGALWANLHGIAQLWSWGSLQMTVETENADALLRAAIDAYVEC